MQFTIKKEIFFNAFKKISNILTKNPIYPILENVLLEINEKGLQLFCSNLDLEISILIPKKELQIQKIGKITIAGKKLLNICRNIPSQTILKFQIIDNVAYIKILKSNFRMVTLPAKNFPKFNHSQKKIIFFLFQEQLKNIISMTQVAIANQDVRNYLNGMLIEIKNNTLYSVATDGHRMALYKTHLDKKIPNFRIILHKKCIIELMHLLHDTQTIVQLTISHYEITFKTNKIKLTSKLLEGDFPNYTNILLTPPYTEISISSSILKESLLRASILSNTLFKGVTLNFFQKKLIITTNNQNDEQSEDILKISKISEKFEFSLNVFYLLDAINALQTKNINFLFKNPITSIQIHSKEKLEICFIIMPLHL
ncbi:DNA polymerase III subunit beta [Buchnera aphidicola]|uniref:Beta sliding clamp n=1 Tax=Buchnera aphidicola subsp. Tuberolachnus salignus TaxID=98804 RepID=A0A160SX10_BUCTT|nr:DNA polymerase III subunit beta [Buchnera aphidicola]CUR52995.1 DNA polymerase III subunit beta [Buchnera aphidicola (Tuberolachnus salignus)]